ncbi:MAG TPA: GNAT family N-acetyltransferase [Ktedonobacteraceae bacterium]
MVTLQPMTEAEFLRLIEPVIAGYARSHVEDGQWTEHEAGEKSRQETQKLLPAGVATPNHYLFTILGAAQQKVGMLWFEVRTSQRTAFVYYVGIDEPFQRRGYASEAFGELERVVAALGCTRISLHVFGRNRAAVELYTKSGYEMTNILMTKRLDPQ